jgi:ribosomal protein S12 methylthiotransferase
MEELIKEAESLVKKGVKEIMLIAQELTYMDWIFIKEECCQIC